MEKLSLDSYRFRVPRIWGEILNPRRTDPVSIGALNVMMTADERVTSVAPSGGLDERILN